MKSIVKLVLMILFCQISYSQVKVTTTVDKVIFGVIIDNGKDTLKLVGEDMLKITIPKKNISLVEEVKCYISENGGENISGRFKSFSESGIEMECEDGAIRNFDYKKAQLSFTKKSNGLYPFVGLTVLTPGGINLNFGSYFSQKFGVSFSVGYVGFMRGMQGNLLYSLSRETVSEQNIGLCIGALEVDENGTDHWNYIGLVYEWNYRGFFIQPCLSIGHGDGDNPMPLVQVGYIYRFND